MADLNEQNARKAYDRIRASVEGYDSTMATLNDAVIHFNCKREYGELTIREQHKVHYNLKTAFGLLLDREYNRAQDYVNRANAIMNATSH